MADNVAITAGSGTSIATDQVGSDHWQRIKLGFGADGAATDVNTTAGSGLPVAQALVSHFHLILAATTNVTSIKASAGKLRSVHVQNLSDVPIYAKFHDTASTPTAGSGVVMTVGVQAGTDRDFVIPGSKAFTSGIGVSVLSTLTDASTTAVPASAGSLEVFYE